MLFCCKIISTIKYEKPVYVHSKADISQLNLLHGTKLKKLKRNSPPPKKEQISSKVSVTVREIGEVSPGKENENYGGKDLQIRKALRLE